jgi:hypothetical protein
LRKILFLLFLVNLLFLINLLNISTVSAQQETAPAIAFGIKELKTVDLYFAYDINTNSGINYTHFLNFTPIDGVDNIRTALIRIVAEQSGATNYLMYVNNRSCNTPAIRSVVGKAQYVSDFDCTNVINQSGTYYVTFNADKYLDNVHWRAWITYTNNPENMTYNITRNITDTISENITAELRKHNASVFWKLYKIQDDIAGINVSIDLKNVTLNITLPAEMNISNYSMSNITADFEELIALMFALHSTPVTKQYCENETLVTEKIANWTVKGKEYPVTKIEKVECVWGCDTERKECKSAPYIPILIALGIVFFIILLIILIRRYW